MSEKILVCTEEAFNWAGPPRGFSPDLDKFTKNERWLNSLHYVDRAFAEKTERLKQLISYDVIEQGGEWFVYQRGYKGGEERLHSKYSIGVGGHSSLLDFGADKTHLEAFEIGRLRELQEEISLKPPFESDTIGCLYDSLNPVGRVHFGIISKITLPGGRIILSTDEALAHGEFWDKDKIKEHKSWFESWSQILIEALL